MEKMLRENKTEEGQAIVLLVFAIIGMLAFAALAIDGGIIYVERRSAQNAADNAAMAAALALCEEEADIATSAMTVASQNGYNDNGVTNDVTVYFPPANGPYAGDADYVEVIIDSYLSGNFIHLVYKGSIQVQGRAVTHCGDSSVGGQGFPPLPYVVYGGDPNCGESPILVSGNANELLGPVHSNKNWKLSGNANTFGDVTYAGSNVQTNMPNWFTSGPTDNDTAYDWPLTVFNINDYKPGGIYSSDPNYYSANKFNFSNNNYTIPDGIYYAEEEITLSGQHQTCNACTFVVGDPDGKISFSGNHHTLSPYINNLLILAEGKECTSDVVAYSGNNHIWKGIVYSPYGQLQMSGNASNTVDGCLWGAQVKFSGNSLMVSNCAAYITGQKSVNLVE